MKGGRGVIRILFNNRHHRETASTTFFERSSMRPPSFDDEHTDGQAQSYALGELAALVETLENHLLLAVEYLRRYLPHRDVPRFHAGRTAITQPDAAFFRKTCWHCSEVGEYLCQSHGIYIHLHIFGREILEELQRRLDKQAMRLIDVIEQLTHALR